jgi:hypothetical protein
VHSFNLDLQLPTTWLGEVELGRVEELIGRSFACGRILQGRLTGFGHAHGHLRLRHRFFGRGILNQHADIHRACPERRWRGEDSD